MRCEAQEMLRCEGREMLGCEAREMENAPAENGSRPARRVASYRAIVA